MVSWQWVSNFFFHFSPHSIHLVQNVDLRLDCKKHVSYLFPGVRTLCNCGKECEAFNVETGYVFIDAIKSNAHASGHSAYIHWFWSVSVHCHRYGARKIFKTLLLFLSISEKEME